MPPIRRINGNPGLVMKHLAFRSFNNTHGISKRLAPISRLRDGDPAHTRPCLVEHTRVNIIVRTKCKANIGGKGKLLLKTRQQTAIHPGTASIERGEIADLEAILGQVSEKFGTANQIEGIVRILGQHRLTMRQKAIMADPYIEKR